MSLEMPQIPQLSCNNDEANHEKEVISQLEAEMPQVSSEEVMRLETDVLHQSPEDDEP